jgi:hypothetical protein
VNDRKFSGRILWIVIVAVIALLITGGYLSRSLFKKPLVSIARPYIVFSSEGAVYRGSIDGKTIEKIVKPPSKTSEFSFRRVSKDSEWLVYTIWDPQKSDVDAKNFIKALNLKSGEVVYIASDYWESSYAVSFIDNSHRILYGNHGVQAPYSYVAIFDLDKKTNTYLLSPVSEEKDYAFDFILSDDGTKLAYAGGKYCPFGECDIGLWVKNLATNNETKLYEVEAHDFIELDRFINNNTEVVFVVEHYDEKYNPTSITMIANLKNGSVREASEDEMNKFNSRMKLEQKIEENVKQKVINISESNECNKVVIWTTDGNSEKLWLSDLNGENVEDLNIVNPNRVDLSNDCKKLIYQDGAWFLKDLNTNETVNLNTLFKLNIGYAVYVP